jgi:low affinity Fe/Cu permease
VEKATTIITFLMVFLIQRSQNKDARAVHLKLNDIVAALQGASNRLINVEDLTEVEIRLLHSHYQRLVTMAKRDLSLTVSHSVEEGGRAPPREDATLGAGGGPRSTRPVRRGRLE